ncbi:MAG: hypothetical protein RLZZ76_166 [Candidatus Parcubacteria bacterium]|jgi:hypothetical protein
MVEKTIEEKAIEKRGGICKNCKENKGFSCIFPNALKVRKVTPDNVTVRVQCALSDGRPVSPVVAKCSRLVPRTRKTYAEWLQQNQQAVALGL